jgi:hypothetical protein
MKPVRGLLFFTFEFEAYPSRAPNHVECQITYNFWPGSPETGRFGAPENYDTGSGHEVEYLYAERDVGVGGQTIWQKLLPGEFLDEQCVKYLESRETDDLVEPDDGPDPDDARDALIERRERG